MPLVSSRLVDVSLSPFGLPRPGGRGGAPLSFGFVVPALVLAPLLLCGLALLFVSFVWFVPGVLAASSVLFPRRLRGASARPPPRSFPGPLCVLLLKSQRVPRREGVNRSKSPPTRAQTYGEQWAC